MYPSARKLCLAEWVERLTLVLFISFHMSFASWDWSGVDPLALCRPFWGWSFEIWNIWRHQHLHLLSAFAVLLHFCSSCVWLRGLVTKVSWLLRKHANTKSPAPSYRRCHVVEPLGDCVTTLGFSRYVHQSLNERVPPLMLWSLLMIHYLLSM